MRYLYKIAFFCCAIAFGLPALTGCEGGDLYQVNAPDWISQKIDSINNSNKDTEDVLEGMKEDVYAIGNPDFTSGWWSSFSKYYVIPDGEKWNAVFNLNINPSDNTYYKNFALVITNDADRGGTGYTEYGAYRFDATGDSAAYNSQWGTYLYFKFTKSSMLLAPDGSNKADDVQKLGGKVTLTVDRTSDKAFAIKITNGVVTKTYEQPYKEPNLNTDPANTNIRCFLVPEGSCLDFLQTNIEPIGGLTSANDKNPVSMELMNVPDQVNVGTTLEDAMAGISAVVTFEEGVTKTIPVSELYISAIPDMDKLGVKNLIAIYNKTFKGENCSQPIVANATFEVVEKIVSIAVTKQPSHTQYYYYTSAATESLTDRTMAFDPTGMEVTATYANGSSRVVDNSKLTFSAIPVNKGSHQVTITADGGAKASVDVSLLESAVSKVSNTANILGAEDNSTAWWSVFTDDFNVPAGATKSISFTNYSNLAGNWNNFVVILRKADLSEYAVVRADNYGWGNGYAACAHNGTQNDWATWLTGMNGAKVTVYVTNCANGTADIQAVMKSASGTTSTQYYLGINTVDSGDLNFALTVDGSHLVFNAE